ncbi:MAG TPA: hypothetical protein VH392_09785 [Sphingomicrobium sp.]|jgi:hypothetical protein
MARAHDVKGMEDSIPLARIRVNGTTLATANREILWGWKRDVGEHFRVVYFAGTLGIAGANISLGYRYFFYRHRLPSGEAEQLRDTMAKSDRLRELGLKVSLDGASKAGLSDLLATFGKPRAADLDRSTRLQRRRPRRSWKEVAKAPPTDRFDPALLFPADLYVGSGLSYEAGLPTLCDVHKFFGVDTADGAAFTVGARDPLPGRLAKDPLATLRDFCRVHTQALAVEPTSAMWAIKRLYDEGFIGKVFTDNVDNLLGKVGVPYERTRGSGVFNERYPAKFGSRNLIVIGVAADRRSLVAQARGRRLDVTVVNPCASVAPRVRHLDYLREKDLFLKITAENFFSRALQLAEAPRSMRPAHSTQEERV